MSFANQATEQKFPFPYDNVFDGLMETLPKAGFTVKSSDKLIGRIFFSAGWSLFSFGENLTIVVEKIDERTTKVGIQSALKLGMNVAGAHRHSRNFNKIITTLSSHLQLSGTGNFKDRDEPVIQRPPSPPSQPAPKPIASESRAPNPSAPTLGGPRAGKFKLPVTWVTLGSVLFLVLVIVVVVAIPGEDEVGAPVAYQTPEQAVRSAIVEALGKSNREVPGGSSNSRQVQNVAFNDGVITVQWTINENLFSGMRTHGAKMDVIKILKAVQGSSIPYESILVEGTFPLVDKYGNASERQVVTAPYDRSTVDKINWDNFLTDHVFQIADGEFGALLHKDFRD